MSEDRLNGLKLLMEPFPASQISKLPKNTIKIDEWNKLPRTSCHICGGFHPKTNTIHLDYVGHAALTLRLCEADQGWSWEPLAWDAKGSPMLDENGGMWINLTVCGVTRLGYGDAQGKTGSNAVKERIGDALRNAAMRFGAAIDQWSKADLRAEDEPPEERPMNANILPPHPEGSFNKKKDGWMTSIKSSERTAENLIGTLETRYTLTNEQKDEIHGWKSR